MLILNILLFILFLFIFIYFPSYCVLFNLGFIQHENNPVIRSGVILIFGVCLSLLGGLLLGLLHIPYVFLWVLPALLFLKTYKQLKKIRIRVSFNIRYSGILLILIISSFCQSAVLLKGGELTSSGLMIPSLHDTGWNLSLVESLANGVPPEHPAESGLILKNNHYFYPLFLTLAEQTIGVGRFDLYFKLAPLFVSLLFGIGIYAFSTLFIKKYYFQLFSILFGFWGGNISYMGLLFFGKVFDWRGNSFYADQPFDQMLNPYTVLGFSFILLGIYIFHRVIVSNKLKFTVLPTFIFGMLFGFKSFGGILAISSMFLTYLIVTALQNKIKNGGQNRILLFILIGVFTVFIPVFFLIARVGQSAVIWIPGWILNQLVTSEPYWQKTGLASKEAYYQAVGNTLGFLKIKGIELAIYTVGNFGSRILAILVLFYLFFKSFFKKSETGIILIFSVCIVLSGFLFPLLFNLRFSSFNIIQFTPYAFILLDPLSALFFEKIYVRFKKRSGKILACLGIIALSFISFPVNIKNFRSHLASGGDVIVRDEYDALGYIAKNTDRKSIVLIDPLQYSGPSIYVRFLSGRSIYFISSDFLTQTGEEYLARENKVKNFFKIPTREFINQEKINYIYLLKNTSIDNLFELKLNSLKLPIFYENKTVIIYKS